MILLLIMAAMFGGYRIWHQRHLSTVEQELQRFAQRYPQAREYARNYARYHDQTFTADLSEYENCSEVPLLLQWDKRWGYLPYAGGLVGYTGCGPTCLSMAAIYLTGDSSMDPGWMARFSRQHMYESPGHGTSWTLISEGAQKLGLSAEEVPLDEERMASSLQEGKVIICVVGPGDFTDSGHFLVLTGYEDGQFRLNDPNSPENSEKLWSYETLKPQLRVIWALEKA